MVWRRFTPEDYALGTAAGVAGGVIGGLGSGVAKSCGANFATRQLVGIGAASSHSTPIWMLGEQVST